MEKELQINDIAKNFGGVRAVSGVSFTIKARKVLGLVGPNGSGKSTFVNLVSGLLVADSGSISVGGKLIQKSAVWKRRGYGFVRTFQESRLWNQLSVLDNVLVMLTERGVFRALFERHKSEHKDKALDVLTRVGLFEKRNELVQNLSYGQRKLLEVARAVASGSDFYFFDEPFAGLFPQMVGTVSRIILELKNSGAAVVLIEHDMKLIRELCDVVAVLDGGELLAYGRPDEVLSKREVVEAYLGT